MSKAETRADQINNSHGLTQMNIDKEILENPCASVIEKYYTSPYIFRSQKTPV